MSENKIYWKEAVERIKSGECVSDLIIDFRGEKLSTCQALCLMECGVRIPEELMPYDTEFEYADIPQLSSQDLPAINAAFMHKKPCIDCAEIMSGALTDYIEAY